jgi:hypothetical protein
MERFRHTKMVTSLIKHQIVPYVKALFKTRDRQIASGAIAFVAIILLRWSQRRNVPKLDPSRIARAKKDS